VLAVVVLVVVVATDGNITWRRKDPICMQGN